MDAIVEAELIPVLARRWSILPLLAVLAIAFALLLYWRRCRKGGEPLNAGVVCWMALFALLAGVLFGFCIMAECGADVGVLASCSAVVALCGCCVPLREKLRKGSAFRNALLVCLASVFAFLAIETACKSDLLAMEARFVFANIVLILLALSALFFACQQRGWLPGVLVVALDLLAVAENYVLRFRMSGIRPTDLAALSTAAYVAGGYRYTLDNAIALSILFAAVALLCLFFCFPSRSHGMHRKPAVGFNLACSAALCACLGVSTVAVNYEEVFDFEFFWWRTQASYDEVGFVAGFISALQDYRVERPAGYSEEHAQELIEQYASRYDERMKSDPAYQETSAQFDTLRPNVVAIMCEAYSDLSVYNELGAGYEGPWVVSEPDDALERGYVFAPVLGGGTSNTEFEFFSGISMSYIGAGRIPFVQYAFDDASSISDELGAAGYETDFMHPAPGANWSREAVYTSLGFDRQLYIEQFDGAERFHDYTTDSATYDKVLALLQENEKPQFVFDVTVQNHGGRGLSSIPADEQVLVDPQGFELPGERLEKLEVYLSCIAKSDRALQELIESLRQLDEPTVVVFFGDHQPGISRTLNEVLFPESDEFDEVTRLYRTPYFVWANYDVAGSDTGVQGELSANYLGLHMLELIGAPLFDWQKAELEIMQEMPVVGVQGTRDAQGNWVEYTDGFAAPQASNDLACILYYRYQNELR